MSKLIVTYDKLEELNKSQQRQLLVAVKAQAGMDILPFVPNRTGDLMKSVAPSIRDNNQTLIFASDYASYVHEGTYMKFYKGKHPKAQAKFTEKYEEGNIEKVVDNFLKMKLGW